METQLPVHKKLILTNHVLILMLSAFLKRVSYLIDHKREASKESTKSKKNLAYAYLYSYESVNTLGIIRAEHRNLAH